MEPSYTRFPGKQSAMTYSMPTNNCFVLMFLPRSLLNDSHFFSYFAVSLIRKIMLK